MPLDFGLYQGLNVKVDYDARMERNLQEKAYERQTRIDAENKAKLLGQDFKLASVSSPYNRQRLNEFYKTKLTDIGKFVLENRDLQLNPAKMLQFSMMKQELLDNDIVAEDMNFKAEYDATTKWLHDNPGAADYDSEVQKMLDEMENYRNYGTTDLMSKERKKYTFINPDSKIDITKELVDVFSKVEGTGFWKGDNEETLNYVTEEDLTGAANYILSNPKYRRVLEKEFALIDPETKAKRYKNDLTTYIKESGKAFAKQPNYEKGFAPSKYNQNGSSGSSDEIPGIVYTPFETALQLASTNPNGYAGADAEIFNSHFVSKNGFANLDDGFIVSTKGNDVLDPSKDFNDYPTPRQKGILRTVKAEAMGGVKFEAKPTKENPKNGNFYTDFEVTMPMEKFIDYIGADSPILDLSGLQQLWGGAGSNTGIHGQGSEDVWFDGEEDGTDRYRLDKDENGEKVVKFTVRKPISPRDQGLAFKFGQAANAKTVNAEFNPQQTQYQGAIPYQRGQSYPDGSHVTFEDGTVKTYIAGKFY